MKILTLSLPSLEATDALGTAIGRAAVAGDILYLNGPLGAGKTTLTKAIGTALGIPADSVTSPTFSLVNQHTKGRIPIYHLDIYRLKGEEDLENVGLADIVSDEDGLIVIEWASNAADGLPKDGLNIDLAKDPLRPDARTASFSPGGQVSDAFLQRIESHLKC